MDQVKYKSPSKLIAKIEIDHQEKAKTDLIMDPPSKALLNRISQLYESERNGILKIREKVLSFDKRMTEITDKSGVFLYGKGKNKPCIEINLAKTIMGRKTRTINNIKVPEPKLLLWLPYEFINPYVNNNCVRMLIDTDWLETATITGYTPQTNTGFSVKEKPYFSAKKYNNSLDELIDIALETWLKRL